MNETQRETKDDRSRVPFGARFPEPIKEGIRAIARSENKSMNWVMEEVIIDYFNLKRPRYVEEKPRLRLVKRGA